MFDRIKALLHRWQGLRDIDALTDRDLHDPGFSRARVLDFATMPADISERIAAERVSA